jgi:hypothetical protein
VRAIILQSLSESGEGAFPVADHAFQSVIVSARAAIAYWDERANDRVIDLDAVAWAQLKKAIEQSPRFKEMYDAGGTFTDACSSVHSWLHEVPDEFRSPGM